MGRWKLALEKVGLIELSAAERAALAPTPAAPAITEDEQSLDELLAESAALTASIDDTPSAPPPPPPTEALSDGDLFAGRELEAIYADANVPTSPYPAEQLLRVLDGLQAMNEPMRRAAIDAMDAADDAWTLEDPLVDAQRKVRVLEGELHRLGDMQTGAETQATDDLTAQDAYQEQATQTIRAQIAELEAMLENELRTVADERARIQRELEEKRGAIAREAARYQDEIARLQSLVRAFPDTHS